MYGCHLQSSEYAKREAGMKLPASYWFFAGLAYHDEDGCSMFL
jgi:hypothetical protein